MRTSSFSHISVAEDAGEEEMLCENARERQNRQCMTGACRARPYRHPGARAFVRYCSCAWSLAWIRVGTSS